MKINGLNLIIKNYNKNYFNIWRLKKESLQNY